MIWTIARHELAHLRRDGRLRAAAWLGVALLAGVVLLGWQSWRRDRDERAQFETKEREQWENQGEKHPHRAAHFGFYLLKPELPLALFDAGIKPVTGQVLWLEAHSRSAFSYSPMEDAGAAGVLGLTCGAEVLQLLGALVVILTAYGSVAREREDGTLRLLLAQGVSPLRWFAGKCLGLGLALSALGLPVALGILAACAAADPAGFKGDVIGRAGALVAIHLVYFSAWLAVAVAVSARVSTARNALAVLLVGWIAGGVLAPRLASTLASQLAPVPSTAAFAAAHTEAFNNGFDGQPGWNQQLAALEKQMLQRHGVATLDDLSVGFSGIRMQAMDAFSNRISDFNQRRLEAIYSRQNRWHLVTAALGPFVPMRAASQNLSGMDWPHYLHFAEAAEQYRRTVVHSLDELLEKRLKGNKWEVHFDHETWSSMPAFSYALPRFGWAMRQSATAMMLVGAWALIAFAAAALAARRISP